MRYVIKRKLFSLTTPFRITDDAGKELFSLKRKAFNFLGDSLTLIDADGEEIASAKQQIASYPTTWEIHRDGDYQGFVRQDPLTLVKSVFNISVRGASLVAELGYSGLKLTFNKDERPVAVVTRGLFWAGKYDVNIDDNQDDVLILISTMVVINMATR